MTMLASLLVIAVSGQTVAARRLLLFWLLLLLLLLFLYFLSELFVAVVIALGDEVADNSRLCAN